MTLNIDSATAELYRDCWVHWGSDAQLDMLIEEMSELTKEILKARRRGEVISMMMIEEVADVQICLEQLLLIMKEHFTNGSVSDLNETYYRRMVRIRERKLVRLKDRLDESLVTCKPIEEI